MPSRSASALPLSASATPAQSVTTEASPKSSTIRVVEKTQTDAAGRGASARARRRPRTAAGHRDLPARILARAVDQVEADEPDHDDRDRGRADDAADRRGRFQQRAHLDLGDEHDHEQAFDTGVSRPTRYASSPCRPDGEVAEEGTPSSGWRCRRSGCRPPARGGPRPPWRRSCLSPSSGQGALRRRAGSTLRDRRPPSPQRASSASVVFESRICRPATSLPNRRRRSGRGVACRARPHPQRCGPRRTDQIRPPRLKQLSPRGAGRRRSSPARLRRRAPPESRRPGSA